ncbi:MAG: hypothetical protein M3O26_18805 [Pseudomonadota bacterium]|nr:hypothetical protein [Pseudomonadota bacterium]
MNLLWLFALIPLLLGACSSTPPAPGHEIFDEQTGNTLTVVSKPIVFARERTDVAAHARDYATLVAVEVDHSGTFKNYLLLHRWSTVDTRMSPPPGPEAGEMRLLGEGRELKLQPLDSLPISVTSGRELYLPRHGAAVTRAFAVDGDILRFIAASRTLILQMPKESLDAPFQIWDDGRGALLEFLQQTSAPAAPAHPRGAVR